MYVHSPNVCDSVLIHFTRSHKFAIYNKLVLSKLRKELSNGAGHRHTEFGRIVRLRLIAILIVEKYPVDVLKKKLMNFQLISIVFRLLF